MKFQRNIGKAHQTTGKEHAFIIIAENNGVEHAFIIIAENNGVEMIAIELFIPTGFTLQDCFIIIQKNIYIGK